MATELDQRIRELANGRCEYCRTPETFSPLPFVLDHVIARQHGGSTELQNLALCCPWCNRHKGPNIAGVDPQTNQRSFLFHPREQVWNQHFQWNGDEIRGISSIGRATVLVLKINHPTPMAARIALIRAGLLVPGE